MLRNLLFGVLLMNLLTSCLKEEFTTDPGAMLAFSTDTVMFDTVFTREDPSVTRFVATQRFVIYNPADKFITVSDIYVGGGSASSFLINVDGESSNEVHNVEIGPHDSAFIFVTADIDPRVSDNPLLIEDSIIFVTNGNQQRVILEAWGQDVHFFKNEIIGDSVWTDEKPYLIYGNLVVDEGATLTIKAGARVHFHRWSSLVVFGTLIVEGTLDEPVTFQGDRPEELYDSLWGQWGTIALLPPSTGNSINYAKVFNATAGFQVGDYQSDHVVDLLLTNTMVYNSSASGLYAFGAQISGFNLLFFNNLYNALTLIKGGDYQFAHCTFVGYYAEDPLVGLTNAIEATDENGQAQLYEGDMVRADFRNSVFASNQSTDLVLSGVETKLLNFNFQNCLMRLDVDDASQLDTTFFRNILLNKEPKFKNPDGFDFSLDTLSLCKDYGNKAFIQLMPDILSVDLVGTNRDVAISPDIGAFERKE